MPETKGQNFQDVQESSLDVTGVSSRSTNETIFSALDQDKNQPLRLYESTTPDANLNIEAQEFQMYNGVSKSITPISNQIPSFASTTINFQTQVVTGGTVNITWPTSTVGQYRILALTLLGSGEIEAQFSDEETTIGALPDPGGLFIDGGLPIGWIVLECTNTTGYFKTAGSTTNIIENKVGSDSRIFIFGSGGGGSSSSSSGGINYINQSNAEGSISDWSKFDDGGSYVDGTGGTASNIVFGKNSTTPLRGIADFDLVVSAADASGEGVSVDFDIDKADKYSVQYISFDYLTDAPDDFFSVRIYDKTNGNIVYPTPQDLGAHSNETKFLAQFQTSDSTSYRLSIFVNSTDATGYTINFDNVSVGPNKKLVGSPITDWVDSDASVYFSGGFTQGNGTIEAKERRVGDCMEFQIYFKVGSTSVFGGSLRWVLPTAHTIDTNKIAQNYQVNLGAAYFNDSSASISYQGVCFLNNNSTTYLECSVGDVGERLTNSNPVLMAVNDEMWATFSVPIAGFASNVKMADIDTNRTVACLVRLTSDQTITTQAGTGEQIDLDGVEFDTHGGWDNVNHWYEIPVSGYYHIRGHVWSQTIFTDGIIGVIYIDSVALEDSSFGTYVPNAGQRSEVSTLRYLTKGQKVLLGVWQNESTSETVKGNATTQYATNMSIHKIGSSEAVFASEIVYVDASTNAAQSIGTGETDIVYEDIEKDTHNAYNASTGEFTVPVTKAYNFSACIEQNFASFTAGHGLSIYINVDGTKVLQRYTRIQVTGSQAVQASLNKTLYLTKGQVVKITADSNVAGNLTSGAIRNNMSIQG